MANHGLNQIRGWIDAKPSRPIIAAIGIVELPVICALCMLCGFLGAPWWVMPSVLGCVALIVGWIWLVVAALTRWLE